MMRKNRSQKTLIDAPAFETFGVKGVGDRRIEGEKDVEPFLNMPAFRPMPHANGPPLRLEAGGQLAHIVEEDQNAEPLYVDLRERASGGTIQSRADHGKLGQAEKAACDVGTVMSEVVCGVRLAVEFAPGLGTADNHLWTSVLGIAATP